jgi:hypothetical protein
MRKQAAVIIQICVFDAKAEQGAEAEKELVVDVAKTHARIWLSSFIVWAAHDGKVLEIMPAPNMTPNFVPRPKHRDHHNV